jgi:hypothetical protein
MAERVARDWSASSFELLRGIEVSEDPDAITDALFDELFRSQDRSAPGSAG